MARASKLGGRAARRGARQKQEADSHDTRSVLLVENSAAVAQMVSLYIAERCGRPSVIVRTLAQARQALEAHDHESWYAAVVNLELPDAADGEDIVAWMLAQGLPTIVLTGTFNQAKRARILRHDIVDYCLKGKAGLEELVKVIERLGRNPSTRVLVLDESMSSRAEQLRLLKAQRLQVEEASSVQQALALYREQRAFSLVMLHMQSEPDALAFVTELRELAGPDELAIMALATHPNELSAVQFLKAGASDFLQRPFEKEEYAFRVYACLDRIESIRRIKQLAFSDALTGVANRMAFFRQVPEQLSAAMRKRAKPVVALWSIDQLRRINEQHSHSTGDAVLQHVASVLGAQLGPNAFLARFSGEQFCAFIPDAGGAALTKLVERVRGSVERGGFKTQEGKGLAVTVSCGVVAVEGEAALDGVVNRADEALEEAEEAGGNRVVVRV
jgi:diguanylate cyclase (GGDEF)-like protein